MPDLEPPPATDPTEPTDEQSLRRGESLDRPADARHLMWSFVGMTGMAAALFLVVIGTSLVAPWWAVLVLSAVWVVLFVLGTRWFLHHPGRVGVLPVAMVVIWVGAVVAGDLWLGWVA